MICRRSLRGMAAALALAGLTASGFGGCSLRDRSNPLDPKNQSTHGMLTGFNAIGGDGVVELRWNLLTQEGVSTYRVDRWIPGGEPLELLLFPAHVGASEDMTVTNDSTYIYRLVAHFSSGDSAVSPPDTVTPGTLRTMVLVASLPGIVGLSPDGRDVLYANAVEEPYDDLELDSGRGIFWLSQYERGLIVGRRFEGTGTVIELTQPHPTDLAVAGGSRGVVWVALPEQGRVNRFESVIDSLVTPITGVGPARVVEADPVAGTVWVGSDDGSLYHASAQTSDTLQSWHFGGRVAVIAVDQSIDVAWVAVRSADLFDLYRVVPGNPGPELVKPGLVNVTDMEVEAVDRTLWVSERGAPLAGNGRLTRLGRSGQVLTTVAGIEPYALSVEPGSRDCWVTDIRSDRLLHISALDGAILRRSPRLGVPYGVRVYRP